MEKTMLKRFLQDTSGSSAIEYGLIGALVVAAIVASISSVGTATGEMYDDVGTQITQ